MMDLQAILDGIHAELLPRLGEGKVADYIPELAKVDPRQFGMAIATVDGQVHRVGDAEAPFSIQSISKVFMLTLALGKVGEQLWTRVGREPSGSAFNSIVQLEHESGIPRNPFINAGAIAMRRVKQSASCFGSCAISPMMMRSRSTRRLPAPRRRPVSAISLLQISCGPMAISITRSSMCSASIFTSARCR
jgi:glutaminase